MKSKTTSATTFKILFSRLLCCLIIFTSFIIDARAQVVNANLIITPPYSVYFRDYSGYGKANNMLLSVNSTTNRKVYLAGSVTKDDNSIVIGVKNGYRPLVPTFITANVPLMLNGLQLRKIFGDGTTDDLNLTGLTANDIGLNQALPEGSYTFCIKVKDYDTREVISTACKTIFVTYSDPPQIITPKNGTSVQGSIQQKLDVTWRNTGAMVFGVTYRLKMVKLIKGITPLDAINNNVQLLLDKGNITPTQYSLDVASGIKLEAGQTYAMQVMAQSPTAYFKNGGKSDVTVFTYRVREASVFTLKTPDQNVGVTDIKDLNFTWDFIDKSNMTEEERATQEFRGYKYNIQIKRVLSTAEQDERAAKSKRGQDEMDAANEIYLNSKTDNLSYNSKLGAFLKSGNNYEWNVTHFATRTVSETRMFTAKNNTVISNYTVELNGKLKYNFRDNFLSASAKIKEAIEAQKAARKAVGKRVTVKPVVLTEAEKGFDLALTNLQVLKVRLLAKMITTKDSVEVIENKLKVKRFTTTVTPQIVNDLNAYPTFYRDITNAPVVVDNAVTDNNGNFTVSVPINTSEFGVIDSFAYTKDGETYALVEGLVVKVNDSRFTDPGWFIVPNSNKPKVIMDEAIVQIIDYKLNVSFNTESQRNFKGKLYLLKSEKELINGEADNLKGQSKKITYVSEKQYYNEIRSFDSKMVGSRSVIYDANVEGESWVFNNLVPKNTKNDHYTLYFEPEDKQNSLFFSLQTVSKGIPTKTGFSFNYVNKALETSIKIGPQFMSMRISGRYLYQWKDQGKAAINPQLPLPEGTTLTLMKGYISSKGLLDGTKVFDDKEKVVSTTVGKNGEFKFNLGLLNYDDFNKEKKQLVIIVDNDYYYSQPLVIEYNEERDVQVGELLATVKQFKLKVKLGYMAGGKVNGVKGLDVYLCRKKAAPKPMGFPDTDGDLTHKTYFKTSWTQPNGEQFEIIDKGQSDADGIVSVVPGDVSFSRLVVPLLYNNEDNRYEYFILAEPKSDNPFNYITEVAYPLSANLRDANHPSLAKLQKSHFSDNQVIKTFNIMGQGPTLYVPVVPQRPIIDGAVYPQSNTSTAALSGVTMELYDMDGLDFIDFWGIKGIVSKTPGKEVIPEKRLVNGTNGRFLFDNFKFGKGSGWKMLKLSKKGFITTYHTINTGKPLQTGDRANLAKLFLELPLEFSANVVNQNGETVGARIIVGDDFSWADTELWGGAWDQKSRRWVGGVQKANLTSPKGEITLTIIPNDKTTYKKTVVTRTINNNNDVVEALVVERNQHTVVVTCIGEFGRKIEANVELVNKSITPEKNVDYGIFGQLKGTLSFVAPGTQFDLKVTPVGNYTIAKTQIHSDMSETVYATVYVKPAGTIRTHAVILETGQPDNAKGTSLSSYGLSVLGFDEDEYVIEQNSGRYTISRLPLDRTGQFPTFKMVSGDRAGYIGDTKTVSLTTSEIRDVKFIFRKLPDNFPENLYKFPITIRSKVEIDGGKFIIAGKLNPAGDVSKSNLQLSDPENWLTFYNVTIKPGQKGEAASIESDVDFYENELKAKLHTNYDVNIVDEKGLSIMPDGESGNGSIWGRVQLDPASLAAGLKTSQSGKEGAKNFLYLNNEESDYEPSNAGKTDNMRTFSTATSDMLNRPLLVSTSTLKKPVFIAADDLLIIPDEKVMFTNTGMTFKGSVKTSLKNVIDDNRNINASATFKIDRNGYTSSDEQPVNVGLSKWQLQIQKWKLNKNGFTASEGYLNALGLTIPFSNLPITYSQIGYGNFQVSKLKLLNAFDITLDPRNLTTSFGFDNGYSNEKGAWSVSILPKSSITPLASLNGLPDLDANDKIEISNINLYDTDNPADTRILLKQDQPALTLNNISKFSPGTVSGGVDYISFKGGLDLNVPNLSGLKTESYELVYKVIDGKFQHDPNSAFKGLELDANGIIVKFDEKGQRFTNNELLLKGVLTDKAKEGKDAYNIKVELSKKENGTILQVQKNTKEVVYMGGSGSTTYLDNVTGSMQVTDGGVWDNFKFEGDLVTPSGVDPSKLKFIVKGDLVADEAQVGVQNMGSGGVSGLSLTYDFGKSALVGSCHIDQPTDFADITADVEMFIGAKNFYIFSNGVARNIKSSPISQAAFGMLVGATTLSPEQISSFNKHFKNGDVSDGFKSIKSVQGVLFIVSIDVPIPILPTFDINLQPVAHAELKHGIYGNIYFNANFSKKPEDLEMTIGGRLGGFVKVGVGASIGLACASIALSADVHGDASGTLAPLTTIPNKPKIKVDLGVTFELTGEAYVGAGVCNSSCQTPCVSVGITDICSPIPCVKVGGSKTLKVGVSAEMTETSVQLKAGAK